MENILAMASITAMVDFLKAEGFYEGAKLLLLDSIQTIRNRKRELEGLNSTLLNCFLTPLLTKLASIHAETRSLVYMKLCLEECIELAVGFNRSEFDFECKDLAPAKYDLARYASYTGNDLNALKLIEEVIEMEKKDPTSSAHLNALHMSAVLHFRLFGSREKCIELFAEENDLQKGKYGSNSWQVGLANEVLEKLQRGDEPQVVIIENVETWLGLKFADEVGGGWIGRQRQGRVEN